MRLTFALALWATTAQAQTVLTCGGDDPAWALSINDSTARFDFHRQSDLTLMLTTTPLSHDSPQALTFTGRNDSLIAIIEEGHCRYGSGTHSATILTQRGQTPLMLLGCCAVQ